MNNLYGFEIELNQPFNSAIETVNAALMIEGFGILTKIDVRETLKKKLNKDFRPFIILGACNPPLAFAALSYDPVVALMMPCNVTIEEATENSVVVRFANPAAMAMVVDDPDHPDIKAVASEAEAKIKNVIAALKTNHHDGS